MRFSPYFKVCIYMYTYIYMVRYIYKVRSTLDLEPKDNIFKYVRILQYYLQYSFIFPYSQFWFPYVCNDNDKFHLKDVGAK